MKKKPDRIVFFDGLCHLCNKSVRFLLRIDRNKNLRYAPLQGSTAVKFIHRESLQSMDSMVYLRNDKLHLKSDAALWLLFDASLYFKWIIIFFIIPRFIRNLVYDFIAKRRYQWFGKYDECAIPTKENKHLFLP